ncbi:MAG: metallophosphoesterase [DPANN group archaeon]|nr:metallophosphoesterase [DPANN group archaeon]
MKIAIFSDTHFGYNYDNELASDAYVQAKEAFEISLDCDLILLAGDLFDSRVPKQEVWSEALKLFFIPKFNSSNLEILEISKKNKVHKFNKAGIPVVAIHGTHERRGKGQVNPIELLDNTGFVIHLHGDYVVYKDKVTCEIVAIYGMSGVPEGYTKQILEKLEPKPIEGAFNVFMMHQSLKQYMYTDEHTPALDLEDLPKGYDMIINGHIHWSNMSMIGRDNKTILLLPGSTVTTQIRKSESETPKGVFILDTVTRKMDFVELKNTRPIIYCEIDCTGLDSKMIKNKVLDEIQQIEDQKYNKKPIVRIKINGVVDHSEKMLFSDMSKTHPDIILSIKNNLENKDLKKKIELFNDMRENRMSIDDLGLDILKSKAKELKLDIEIYGLFNLLSEGDIDKAESMIMDNYKIDN